MTVRGNNHQKNIRCYRKLERQLMIEWSGRGRTNGGNSVVSAAIFAVAQRPCSSYLTSAELAFSVSALQVPICA
jgi:hypothetical protein